MSTLPSKVACRNRTLFTLLKLQGRHLVFETPRVETTIDLQLRGFGGRGAFGNGNGHQDARPEPTYRARAKTTVR